MMDESLTSLAIISIQNASVRNLDLNRIATVFAAEKARPGIF